MRARGSRRMTHHNRRLPVGPALGQMCLGGHQVCSIYAICRMVIGQKGWEKGVADPLPIFRATQNKCVFSKIVMIANMPDESSTATVGTLICKITEGKGG